MKMKDVDTLEEKGIIVTMYMEKEVINESLAIEHNLKFPTNKGNVQPEKEKEHVTLTEEKKKVRDSYLSVLRLVENK